MERSVMREWQSLRFRERCEGKSKALLSSDGIVDEVIAEFAPDELDRERRRAKSRNLGLGQLNSRVDNSVEFSPNLKGDIVSEKKTDSGCVLESRDDDEFSMHSLLDDIAGNVELKVGEENKTKVCSGVQENEDKLFSLNAKFDEEKAHTVCALDETETVRTSGNGTLAGSKIEESTVTDFVDKPEFVLEQDGSLPFYILDAYEETYGVNMGTLYLFGKVKAGDTYRSCCVVVKNMQRCVYAIPCSNVFHNEEALKFEKDLAESRISPAAFCTKLHDLASELKAELSNHLVRLNVSTFSMAPVKRSYGFDLSDVTAGENYVLKINYPFKDPPLPSDLKGERFRAVYGTSSSALELFLVKRKIEGPSWLSLSKFSSCSSHQRVSWCKFEVIVDCSKDIRVSTSTHNTAEVPPVVATAISLKTIINPKHNVHEIVSASIISCNKVKIDTPMPTPEWNRLPRFTVIRKLDGGIFPIGFAKKAAAKNSKTQNNVFASESSERALLNRLIFELYKLDTDVLVGHNISGFDLDILLHRAQACKVPSSMWSKLGRLKRSVMPRLTKGSSAFGLGASPGIMTCLAGRLLCDTFLSSRELLKEVSYSLTELAKTQLKKDRKEIVTHDVPKLFQTTESLVELIKCNEIDAWLSMQLMFKLSILPHTRQLTKICGNLWGKTLQGATAQRVEYLLLHAFHAKKYIVPDKYSSREKETRLTKRKVDHGDGADIDDGAVDNNAPLYHNGKGKKGPAYAGGLVLEPKKGLYDKCILLLDFNSLYPSIIQEYNICFTTVERSSDGSVPRLPTCTRTGILPELLKDLVERWRRVKSWMKNASGLELQQLDIRQQALKLTANSMYGCLGFSNSRFYAKPLAELITSQGREILQSTVDLVQNKFNLEVIYGDTDSIMIYTGMDDIRKSTAKANEVIKEVNTKYRCLKIELDGLYTRMLLLKKKKYAAVKVKDGTRFNEEKGLDMVRRDWSMLAKDVGKNCLRQILSGTKGSCEDIVEAIHNSLTEIQEKVRNEEVALEEYVITKTLTKPPEAYSDAKNQPHVQVALRLKQSGYSTGCSAGDTVPYIICCEKGGSSGTSAPIALRARHPDELKRDNGKWMIDIDYYLSHQIHPVVSRLCAYIQGTSPARLADCLGLDSSKFQSKIAVKGGHDSSANEERYQDCEPLTLSCPSCLNSFKCPSVFQSLCKAIDKGDNDVVASGDPNARFWLDMRCTNCSKDGKVGIISPATVANQVKRQADGFISTYYNGLMMCDDETCNYTTRRLNLRVVGDSERGTICPNYPRCHGNLIRKYTEADLYRQLSYFCHILDTTRCVEKVDANARIVLEKELVRVRPLVELAATTAHKVRDRCAYGWVQINDLFC